jgi:hypothetical protein
VSPPDVEVARPKADHSEGKPLADHESTRCVPCHGRPGYTTVPDEWLRWSLDFGHGFGSTRRAA